MKIRLMRTACCIWPPKGLQPEAKERFFHAHFTEGKALGDDETLVQLAAEVGVAEDEAREVLASDAYADAVRADIKRARVFGIQGVPFFAVDEHYGVSGAQPSELLKEVLEAAWADEHPLLKVVSSGESEDDANACEGDSCAI